MRRQPLWTLGLDPGITTGYAVLDEDGLVVQAGEMMEETILDDLDELIRWINRKEMDLEACIERLAKGRDGQLALSLRFVETAILNTLDTYDISRVHVLPGTWKNSRTASIPYPEEIKSRHAKDAIGIARWRMANRSPNYRPRARFRDLGAVRV